MKQRRIGSVEPFGGFTKWHFIASALLKYADYLEYHKSLEEYIEKIIKDKN